jgi:hypothetical protein
MPTIVNFPTVVKDALAIFGDLFANEPEECVPPFTHGVFTRTMQLMMPTVIRKPPEVTLNPPAEKLEIRPHWARA